MMYTIIYLYGILNAIINHNHVHEEGCIINCQILISKDYSKRFNQLKLTKNEVFPKFYTGESQVHSTIHFGVMAK